jgi:hypothetical protein
MKTSIAVLLLLAANATVARESSEHALAFTHVAVIDATGAPALPDMTVVIENKYIVDLGRSRDVRPPHDATIVDAKRKAIELDDALSLLDAYAVVPIRLVDPSLRQAVELSRQLNVYAYDAYVIACAINQRAPILSLDNMMKDRARSLEIEILEVNPT